MLPRFLPITWLVCLMAFPAVPGRAQTNATPPNAAPDPPTAAPALPITSVPTGESDVLHVFNRPVVILRAKVFGDPPRERVRLAAERATRLIHRKVFGPIETQRRAEGISISVGGEIVTLITPGDVDPFSGKNLEETVDEAVKLLTVCMNEARTQTSFKYLMQAAFKALLATFLFLLSLLLLLKLNRYLRKQAMAAEGKLARKLKHHGLPVLNQTLNIFQWALRVFIWAIVGITTFEWIAFTLGCFPYTRPWGDHLQENLTELVVHIGSSAINTTPDLLVICIIVLLTRMAVKLVRAFFRGIESGRIATAWMEAEAARATQRIVVVLVWLFAIVMMYPYVPGSSSAAFKGISVFVGVIMSLGSSSVVAQFTGGLVLMYSRALKPGEYVRIGELEGSVEGLGFLSTKIRSPKNEELYVPNSVILGTTIKNFTRLASQGGLLIHTTVTIGYDSPWRQVHAMLIEAARRTEGICPEPAPFVLQTALADFYVEYQINACLGTPENRVTVLAALHANIQDVFNESGVQIMSPHFIADKDHPVVVPPENWHRGPAPSDKTGHTA